MPALSVIILMVFVLLSVAFFTLIELKWLGIFHLRLGPDKVGLFGYFQPLADFVKLFIKSSTYYFFFNYLFFYFSPFLGLLIGFIIWFVYFGFYSFTFFYFIVLFFFCLVRVSVFFFLLSGWSSGSIYSRLGSFRAAIQVISYEVSMFFILICLIILFLSFDFFHFVSWISFPFFGYSPLFICWLLCCLAERNRPPFDFSEGESELVSGFNIEYGGGMFSFIFLSEYRLIIFYGLVSSLFFLGAFIGWVEVLLFCVFFFWVRGSFPRLRFDKLIIFNWKVILPLVLSHYIIFCGFVSYRGYFI